jgi:hypothetical protein
VFVAAPIVFLLGFILIATVAGSIAIGIWLIFAAPTLDPAAGVAALKFAGASVIFAAISLAALTALAAIGVVNALAHYARLHYRVLAPKTKGGQS